MVQAKGGDREGNFRSKKSNMPQSDFLWFSSVWHFCDFLYFFLNIFYNAFQLLEIYWLVIPDANNGHLLYFDQLIEQEQSD